MAEGIGGSGINNSSDVQLSDNSKLTAVRVLDVILDLSPLLYSAIARLYLLANFSLFPSLYS